MITCPACNTTRIVFLGILGKLARLSCRLCAWTFHVDPAELPEGASAGEELINEEE